MDIAVLTRHDFGQLLAVVGHAPAVADLQQQAGAALLRLLERCDAIRKPGRFEEALLACECDARGRLGFEQTPYPQRQRLSGALQAALAVETAPVAQAAAQRGLKGKAIGDAVSKAREQAMADWLQTSA